MKKLLIVGLILGCAAVARAEGKSGSLGLGVVLGDITGPTAKYFIGPNTALDVGLGFSSDFEAYGGILFHGWDVLPRPQMGRFAGYLGFGPRYQERDRGDDKFGVRALGGIGYWTQSYPIEIFLEVGPWFIFTPDTDTEFDAGVGLRYYFGTN